MQMDGYGCVGSAPSALDPAYVQREAVVGRLKPRSGGADRGRSAVRVDARPLSDPRLRRLIRPTSNARPWQVGSNRKAVEPTGGVARCGLMPDRCRIRAFGA